MQMIPHDLEAEREELNWLLTSGVLGKSNNLVRLLTYVCEKHFLGQADQIKESTIAIEALGRRGSFDPQTDTIVRVTMHSLRKRLQEIYQSEGLHRPIHILIPSGGYLPAFVSANAEQVHADPAKSQPGALGEDHVQQDASNPAPKHLSNRLLWWIGSAGTTAVVALLFTLVHTAHKTAKPSTVVASSPSVVASQPANTIRALVGTGRKAFVDHSGLTWTPSDNCTGGHSVTVPTQDIAGTGDPGLYLTGIRGIAHCQFPLKQGLYELHLHFAETSNLEAATHPVLVSINAGTPVQFDVVDNAGGDGIATSLVLAGIRPENDGTIHLDYTSEVSLLNAVEILPLDSEKLLPVRFTASPSSYTDAAKNLWLSDRYYDGGRRGLVPNSAGASNRGIYSYDRIGRFRYEIPVVASGQYRVRLFFFEPWFGEHNWGNGGPGSRVFDVSCNGSMILKNFDIMAEGGTKPVIKTFDNVQATAQGKIELSFIPVVNYPIVNAIEVVPEPVIPSDRIQGEHQAKH